MTWVFFCSSTVRTNCMPNTPMTYYTSFHISRLCPFLYISACATGINHFPASLLHEMKEFIMVTVSHCWEFSMIYLAEIDWFINTKRTEFCCRDSDTHLAACRRTRRSNIFSRKDFPCFTSQALVWRTRSYHTLNHFLIIWVARHSFHL